MAPEFAAYVGSVLGAVGTTLGVLNFFRDKAKIDVYLQWDMADTHSEEKLGVIRVTNTGRRAVYYSHVALRLPPFCDPPCFLISGGLRGKKISEGDEPQIYTVEQSDMGKYKKHWRAMRAQVTDSTGKVWESKKLRRNAVPSWAQAV